MNLDWSQLLLANWRNESATPRFASLAAAIEGLILSGDLLPGDRLPAERSLAAMLSVSRSTVVAAYGRLADGGWVSARQGQGTTVSGSVPGHVAGRRRRTPVKNPALLQRDPHAARRAAWIDLALGTAAPDPSWLVPSDAARAIVLRENAYAPEGPLALRERIAERYSRRGLRTSADQVLVCTGAQQALSLLCEHFLAPKDSVVLEDPNYFGAIDLFRSFGARLIGVPVTSAGSHAPVLADALTRIAPKLMYVCPSMHNPTGQRWSSSQTDRFFRSVRRASSSLVVVDDALADIHFTDAHVPAAPDARNVVHVGSLSKALWSGLRIGWLRADPEIIRALRQTKTNADIASGLLNAAIACDLLERFDILMAPRLQRLSRQCDALRSAISTTLPEWLIPRPSGGLFLWVALPHGDGDEFARVAEREGVRVTPGASMVVTPNTAKYNLRLAFTQSERTLLAGVNCLAVAWSRLNSLRKV